MIDENYFFCCVFILRYLTTEFFFPQKLPSYFFHKTVKSGIFRLMSIRHRVKFASFNSPKFKNHSGTESKI